MFGGVANEQANEYVLFDFFVRQFDIAHAAQRYGERSQNQVHRPRQQTAGGERPEPRQEPGSVFILPGKTLPPRRRIIIVDGLCGVVELCTP